MKKPGAQLKLVMPQNERTARSTIEQSWTPLSTIDLFCGAGGITEGFREAGYQCLYANDCMPEAIETFLFNHPEAWAEAEDVENVDPARVRKRLGLKKGALDVLVGGPPCQGFSINAPERFLSDKRNRLFKDYLRFLEEFEPKAFLFENVPGLLSLGDGKVFRQILREFEEHGYHVTAKILFAAHYGVPQERWRLILIGSRTSVIAPPEPTHYATGRANFRSGGTMTFQLTALDRDRLLPAVTVGEVIGDLLRLEIGEGAETVGYTVPATGDYARKMRNPDGIPFNHFGAKLAIESGDTTRSVRIQ